MKPPHTQIQAYNRDGKVGPDEDNLSLDPRELDSRWNRKAIAILLDKVPGQQEKTYPNLQKVSDNYIEDILKQRV